MEVRKKLKTKNAIAKKVIDWEEIARDLRADICGTPFSYRKTQFYK